ncbi:amino acid adenylation domain-containing protein, partial [Spongiimicrobium salis]|uniref:amino acid adenylation domain-containing protein n=1 Tax=Spongiimicrobium salis TaxID=1667022 RepID=UPI00374D7189
FDVRLPLRSLFETPVLCDQARLIEVSGRSSFSSLVPAPPSSDYELSSAQRRLWVLSQFEEGNVAYNMPGAHIFEGVVDVASLRTAFGRLIDRHEILRTTFRENGDGDVRQYISPSDRSGFSLLEGDLRGSGDQESAMRDIVDSDSSIPFDLSEGPLLRAGIYRLSRDRWLFTYTMHHIISDGWSLGVLIRELLWYYNSLVTGGDGLLPPLRIQYKDYSVWQRSLLEGGSLEKGQGYWSDVFSGDLPVLDLATDRPRPAVKTYNGGVVRGVLGAGPTELLKDLCREKGGTLYMGLLAGVKSLLYRYTGQEDIIIGSPIAGRSHMDLEDQIGFYVNTLALRTRFAGGSGFGELLSNVREVSLGAFEHQSYPFDELVDQLDLQRDMSRNALFDVMLVLDNNQTTTLSGSTQNGLTVNSYNGTKARVSQFDLIFDFEEVEDGIDIGIVYNSDIYDRSTIEHMLGHFERLMGSAVADPSLPLDRLEYLGAEERRELLETFNDTAVEYNKGETILDMLIAQVDRNPDALALAFGDKEYTYRELDELSNQFAHYLDSNYNIKKEEFVVVNLSNSEWAIISILAILKSGGAYVPLDSNYPEDRIRYIIKDISCRIKIDFDEINAFKNLQERYDTSPIEKIIDSSDLAYVIYTSGSTGKPKGILLEHSNLYHTTVARNNVYGRKQNFLLLSSISFDSSVAGIFSTISTGGALYVMDGDDVKDVNYVTHFLHVNKITHTIMVPSYLTLLLQDIGEDELFLEQVIVAGEYCSKDLIQEFHSVSVLENCRLFNEYGPTESSVWCTYYEYDRTNAIVPNTIGWPIDNTQIYIVDDHTKLQAKGIIGEICIGGNGVSRGYLNNPELTQEKFVPNPFIPETMIFKTGDMGRWLPDGKLQFVGRKDNQIKIHGYRIELGEIKAVFTKNEAIDQAHVSTKKNVKGENELIVYYVAKGELDLATIRQFLMGSLPAYMIPNHYVKVDKIPLSPNGKVDEKLLLKMYELLVDNNAPKYTEPRNTQERRMVDHWELVLEKKGIGIDDDFFDLGGNSINAIQIAKLDNVPLKILYSYRNIRAITNSLNTLVQEEKTHFLTEYSYDKKKSKSIVLVPYAGALSTVYYSLAEKLSLTFNVYIISMPWHEVNWIGTYQSFNSIKESLIEEITTKLKEDIFIFGHCSGTSMAIYLSYELQKLNMPLKGLFLGGSLFQRVKKNIEFTGNALANYKDEHIREFLIDSGLIPRDMNKDLMTKIVKNFKHDSEVAMVCDSLSVNNNAKLQIPIHGIYGAQDELTTGFSRKNKRWKKHSKQVSFSEICDAGHYFISDNAEDTAEILTSEANSILS